MKRAIVSVNANIIFAITLENGDHERYFEKRCSGERFGIDIASAMKDVLTKDVADDVKVEISNFKITCEDIVDRRIVDD